MQITPRPYQLAAVKAALRGLRGRQRRALVVLATGLGKTLTAALIAKQFRGKRILFLVHNNFILDHAIDEFRFVFGEQMQHAVFNGLSKKGADDAPIVFATWQTMGKHLKRWKRNHFDLVIVDEAHHTEAVTYRPVAQYFTGAKLGITATPDRVDRSDIRGIFGSEVVDIALEEAIARGWLPRVEYHVVTDESLDERALQVIANEIRHGKKRFTMAEVNRRIFIRKRDAEIARIIHGYTEKAVVFCASIKHAERMKKSLPLSAVFHSQTAQGQAATWRKNQRSLSELKNGIVRRVCAVNAFNEGMNVPTIGLVAFCRVTGVLTIFRQQLGRGLRPGKDKLIVLDFVGNLERIQLVLKMMNTISDFHERWTSPKERQREGYQRQPFEVSGQGFEFTFSDEVVDLMKVLEHVERDFYPTWQEASAAAIRLGATTPAEYLRLFKNDIRLPCGPKATYPNFPNWPVFLGRIKKSYYKTWRLASKAAIAQGFRVNIEYRQGYKHDPLLPAAPNQCYRDFPGWPKFLGRQTQEPFPKWQAASKQAMVLGIQSAKEYYRRYKENKGLPSAPDSYYSNFPGWPKFLGKKK